jgi:hypothetical protein
VGLIVVAAGLVPAAAHAEPAGSAPSVLEVTDLSRTMLPRGDVAMTSYAARYTLGENIVSTAGGASLPTAVIPPGHLALDGLPNPATGDFVIFSAPAEGARWEPEATQVGGLYMAPRLTPSDGEPPWADVALAGDVVDFGVAHFSPLAEYPEQEARPATGRAALELSEPVTMTLDAATSRGTGGVVVGMRQAYVRIEGGDLDADGLTIEPFRVPLPPGPFVAEDTNVLYGTMFGAEGYVDVMPEYDAATRSMVMTPTLTGHFPESTIPECEQTVPKCGVRQHVAVITAFAFARLSSPDPMIPGMSLRTASPEGAAGVIALSSPGERRPALRVPVEAGESTTLSLGAAVPHQVPESGQANVASGEAVDEPPSVRAGSLAAVLGSHETTTGQVAFDVAADLRGAPAIAAPRIADTGERIAGALQVPYVRSGSTAERLTAEDVVDARYIPAAWGGKVKFTSGWIPGFASAYYGEKPMEYLVAEDTFYIAGATLDLVFRLADGSLLHAETSIIETEEGSSIHGWVDVATSLYAGALGAPVVRPAVLISSSGSNVELQGAVALSTEAALPGGEGIRHGYPGLVQEQYVAQLSVDVVTANGRQTVRPLTTRAEELSLYVLNASAGLPAPAAIGTPPAGLTPTAGVDVVTEGAGATILLGD